MVETNAGGLNLLRGSSVKVVFIGEFPFCSNQVNRDIDVPSCRLGIGTCLFRAVQNRLRDRAFQTRQTDVKPSPERVTVSTRAEIHFGVDGWIGRKSHFHLRGNNLYRTEETTRPSHCEQLFGIGTVAGSARNGKLYVQPTIRGAGRAT